MKKAIEAYLHLPYHVVLVRDEDEEGEVGYVAEVQEMPGCISQGDTPDEAVDGILDAMEGWITVALEDGKVIPEPASASQFNGKILVRVPRTLHASLVSAAELEGVSLNQFIVAMLASAVQWRGPSPIPLPTRRASTEAEQFQEV